MSKVLLAAVASLGLVGCLGGIEGGPGPGDDTSNQTARQLFDTNVHPILAACAGCHTTGHPSGNVTGFYDPNATTAYETATSYTAFVGSWLPESAPVLTKILPNNHNGMHYTDAQVAAITGWLNQEITERNPGIDPNPPAGTETAAAAIKRVTNAWAGCMDFTDFTTAQMPTQFGRMQADNPNERCETCHNTADYGMEISEAGQFYFDTISQHTRYLTQYFYVDTTMGSANAKMTINTMSFMRVALGQAPYPDHPRFNPTNNQGMPALQSFYDLTMAKVTAAGTAGCGPTKLLD